MGAMFYDFIRIKNINLTTIGLGNVDSAALTIFLAGRMRKASRHTLFLIHNVARSFDSHTSFDSREFDFLHQDMERLQKMMDQIIVENTGKNLEDIKACGLHPVSLTAEEAKEFGLIEEII